MRQVKLYTLKEQVVTVSGDYLNICKHIEQPVHIRGSDEFIVDAPAEVKQVPVERYIEQDKHGYNEYIVAFDPKVRKLLHINEDELKTQLRLAHTTNEGLVEYKNQLLDENKDLIEKNSRLCSYYEGLDDLRLFICNMNFFKRLVFLFTGKIKHSKIGVVIKQTNLEEFK